MYVETGTGKIGKTLEGISIDNYFLNKTPNCPGNKRKKINNGTIASN
jgi:hypothetical protein